MAKVIAAPERDRHVRRGGREYFIAFMKLLPLGIAWPRKPDSVLAKVCRGLTNVWGFVDSRAADLLERESDPRKTVELLPDWEKAWGLPDPCFPSAITDDERRRMLVLYMTWPSYAYVNGKLVDWRQSSQSRAYFIWLMNYVGVEVEDNYVGEFAPFMCGVSECGETRPTKIVNGVVTLDANKLFRWYIGPEEQRFAWYISAGSRNYMWFRAGSGQAGVDHHLEIGVPDEVQCLINRWKPAQTDVVMNFNDVGTNDPMAGTP